MKHKKPVDIYMSQKLEPEVYRLAGELLRSLQSYDAASGNNNAPQLRVQLMRFLKKMRKVKKTA